MKFFNQFIIIMCIWILGEYTSSFISEIIYIPGSILGMIFLFLMLEFKIISMSSVDVVSGFFLDNMALFFIPAGVSVINSLDLIKENFLVLIYCIVLSTIIVMFTTGKMVDFLIKRNQKKMAKAGDLDEL